MIKGGRELRGELVVQTSKNATLPIMSACLMSLGVITLNQTPNISDVDNMISILSCLGVRVNKVDDAIIIDPRDAHNNHIDCTLSQTMRSSVFLLGSMLARFNTATINLPGGCKIGSRPIDIHIKAFKKLGVEVLDGGDVLYFDATRARAGRVKLPFPSVGATENIIQFASLLRGKTTIINAAREPEVVDLCNFLNLMGARILGAGTNRITIYGVDKLRSAIYRPMGDRIVSGTLMVAVALCGGKVKLTNAVPYQNKDLIEKLSQMGCQISCKNDIILIENNGNITAIDEITTESYPGFPTDLQSMMTVLSTISRGITVINERIFENRFLIVSELEKMGADIRSISDHTIKVNGVSHLNGAQVEAMDLRGGASLVLAGLAAHGETVVDGVHFIDRGYDHLEDMLTQLGAEIIRI